MNSRALQQSGLLRVTPTNNVRNIAARIVCKARRTAEHNVAQNYVVVRSPNSLLGEWKALPQLAALLAAAFFEDEDAWQRGTARSTEPPLAAALFGWASLLALLVQHATYGNRHVTLLACVSGKVVGCCGLTLEPAPPDVIAATGAPPGSEYGLLTGLAVDPDHRRRGVASELLAAAEALAAAQLASPVLLALLVARTNIPALRLYARQGFMEQSTWVDARWEAEAERGKLGKPRRLLLAKRLAA